MSELYFTLAPECTTDSLYHHINSGVILCVTFHAAVFHL